jgi:hypothetical protein
MKLTIKIISITALFISTCVFAQSSPPIEPAPPGQAKTEATTTTEVQGNLTTTRTQIVSSDDLALGDPLGNRGMTARADAGPPSTHSYCPEGSPASHCVRAARRHNSPTTWQQDCASGLSKACGYR